jgi:beta-barrel assembly-enhancing protease
MKKQHAVAVALLTWMGIAGFAVHRTSPEPRVGLDAPMEIWADVLRDTNRLTAPPLVKEQRLGARLSAMVPVTPPSDPKLQPRVDAVAAKLMPQCDRKEIKYTFTVREDPTLNAFAVPGGYIYVNTGLLSFLHSDDELAVVLGHEISHIELRHATPNLARTVLSLGYSKYQEFDADVRGVHLAARAGYDPRAAIDVFTRLASQQPSRTHIGKARSPISETGEVMMETLGTYWRSHPEAEERVRRISDTLGKS